MNGDGRSWGRRELEARVGRIEQIGGIQRFTLNEGPEAGMEMIRVRTGAGFSYAVTPTKGMDLALAEFRGVPISWSSGNGDVHPAFYNAEGKEWLRTASGGLLMTCGLTQAGSPNIDQGSSLGLHGRIHHTSAKQVSTFAEWSGDEYEMCIRGVLEETSIFGEHLRLTRSIKSRLGENRLTIHDVVENMGFQSCPHMMLYHFNFGFPLMMENTLIELPKAEMFPSESTMDTAEKDRWQAPDPQFKEQVIYHKLDQISAERNRVKACIHNPSFPMDSSGKNTADLTVELNWDMDTLPNLVQWRMPGAGVHVLGLEPSNCWTQGRADERQKKTLRMLEPGESVSYNLELLIR